MTARQLIWHSCPGSGFEYRWIAMKIWRHTLWMTPFAFVFKEKIIHGQTGHGTVSVSCLSMCLCFVIYVETSNNENCRQPDGSEIDARNGRLLVLWSQVITIQRKVISQHDWFKSRFLKFHCIDHLIINWSMNHPRTIYLLFLDETYACKSNSMTNLSFSEVCNTPGPTSACVDA